MAELLRHQSSIAYYDDNHSGCMWKLFNLLDFQRHANKKKMLAYRRHHDGGTGGETKVPASKQKILIRPLDKEVNNQMEDPAKAKSSGKARMLSSLFRKMTKKRDRKFKNSPSAVRLLRTISIHRLECNDYMLPGELTSDNEYSGAELNSQEPDSLISSAELNSQEVDSFISSDHSCSVAEAKKLGRSVALKELISKVLQDPRYILAKHLQDLQPSAKEIGSTKSTSFPGSGLSSSAGGISEHTKDKAPSLNQDLKSQSTKRISNHKTIEESLHDTVSIRWKDFKKRIKDVIRENKKDRRRISMDGILHKVPSGQNLPEYVEKEKLRLYNNTNIEHRQIQRSRSLVDSLDKYSPLLESMSYREPKRLPERLKSLKEEGDKFAERRVLRSHSLTESMQKYARTNESNSVKDPERLKSVQENCGLLERKSMKTFGRILSNPEILSHSFSKDIQNIVSLQPASGDPVSKEEDTYISDDPNLVGTLLNTDYQKLAGTLVNIEESMNLDTAIQDTTASDDSEIVGGLQQPPLIDEQNQNESCIISDDLRAKDSTYTLHEENGIDKEQSEKPPKPSPVSVLGTHFEEDLVSPATHQIIGELPSNWIQFEEQESGSNSENHLDGDSTKDVELIKEQMPEEISEIHSLHIQVDQKDEAEFNYVRDILKKSGFCGGVEDFLGAWYSPYQPLDQFLFKEAEFSADELGDTADGAFDIVDRQLMIDLINEVILEICESSIARSTKFTSSDPRIRPVPMGEYVLEEVWGKISWYLNPQQYTINPLDNAVALDFAKSDGWMDLHWDIESVGLELEGLILDELIDEIII